jgi:hypothetical protein
MLAHEGALGPILPSGLVWERGHNSPWCSGGTTAQSVAGAQRPKVQWHSNPKYRSQRPNVQRGTMAQALQGMVAHHRARRPS